MSRSPRSFSARRALGVSAALALLGLVGCSAEPAASVSASSPSAAVATPTREPDVARVAGYDVGEFPPVPLFTLPDLALLDDSASAFTIEASSSLVSMPGVTVGSAPCDAGQSVSAGAGTAVLYGDGSGSYTGPDGTVRNFGDGSGSTTIGGVEIQNFGDGSGSYTSGDVAIENFGDGSGTYRDAAREVRIFGDGSGNSTRGDGSIQNFGDGSGTYRAGAVEIQNFGDGSGSYRDGTIEIQNFGDGTGRVDGRPVAVAPLPPVPRLGVFPPLAALAPVASCGTTLTLSDAVLFDFDSAEIRPDATGVLDALASLLTRAEVPAATVSGHTDAIGTDAENQVLSERRAQAVVEALRQRGTPTSWTAEGYGESRPVAANEIDGADNPAGRQLNRRVEILVPTFGG
ncbi:OmpA family protein [Microbacterium sp. Kw_RZR3]|uniref:OmpA family protein n=1 Tax=Microbacterium sp. Kw_RZR3 TaxID=3032903 RepID=UPI0023DA8A6A|nr:OmpA family protein [Microbacterium sp. Kw_RZR3]MDF2044628.1 OmpA family protein [Microbacterium sp. Kw_RZR3]